MPIKCYPDSNRGVLASERWKNQVGLNEAPIVGIAKVTSCAQRNECHE